MDAGAEEEFRLFVQARWPALVRTAYLLTGDRGRAEDLVQQVLVKVHRRWTHIAHAESPYAYTRAALADESASWWRRKRVADEVGVSDRRLVVARDGAGREIGRWPLALPANPYDVGWETPTEPIAPFTSSGG